MKKIAFTMAEILLSLTIIGVVAAITLPSLMGNINERTWNTQRKALHARMSQAIAMMPNLNGFGTYIADTKDAAGSVTSSGTDTAAEAFLTEGLSKVLKINNICDYEHFEDCGIPTSVLTQAASSVDFPKTLMELNSDYFSRISVDTKGAAFETQNGESIAFFYNPKCEPDLDEFSKKYHTTYVFMPNKMCANFVYDLNGNKGPNTFGKDIGYITAFYSDQSTVVAPMFVTTLNNYTLIQESKDYCSAENSDWRYPDIFEASSIGVNKLFLGGLNLPFSDIITNPSVMLLEAYDNKPSERSRWKLDINYGWSNPNLIETTPMCILK